MPPSGSHTIRSIVADCPATTGQASTLDRMPHSIRPSPYVDSAIRILPGRSALAGRAADIRARRWPGGRAAPGTPTAARSTCWPPWPARRGVVAAQTEVGAKTNEIPMIIPLLDGVDLDRAVVTADALHTQRATADYLHRRGADFILPAKDNQPGLFDALDALPWRDARSPTP